MDHIKRMLQEGCEEMIDGLSKTIYDCTIKGDDESEEDYQEGVKKYIDRKGAYELHYANFFDNGLESNSFPIEFFSIVSLFAEDCDYNLTSLYVHKKALTINGLARESKYIEETIGEGENSFTFHVGNNELYLRYGHDRLVVVRIQFINRRCGNMEKLFDILQVIAARKGYKEIVIESISSDEMENWCIKHGFKKRYNDYFFSVNN